MSIVFSTPSSTLTLLSFTLIGSITPEPVPVLVEPDVPGTKSGILLTFCSMNFGMFTFISIESSKSLVISLFADLALSTRASYSDIILLYSASDKELSHLSNSSLLIILNKSLTFSGVSSSLPSILFLSSTSLAFSGDAIIPDLAAGAAGAAFLDFGL